MYRLRTLLAMGVLALIAGAGIFPHTYALPASAQTREELEAQVDNTEAQIKKLQDEIKKLESQLTTTTAQKQTLQAAVRELDLQIQKLQKSLSVTQAQISQKDKDITKLGNNISTTEGQIETSQESVADTLRELSHMTEDSMVTAILGGGTLAAF